MAHSDKLAIFAPDMTRMVSFGILGSQAIAWSAVTVVWTETPTGVEANYSGTLDLGALGVTPVSTTETPGAVRNNLAFTFFDSDPISRYPSSGATAGRIVSNPAALGTGSGTPFGFSRDILFIDPQYVSGEVFTGQAVFPGFTLESLFPTTRQEPTDLILSDFIQNEEVVWNPVAGDNAISYLVIPEPATTLLGVVALGAFGGMRRRS